MRRGACGEAESLGKPGPHFPAAVLVFALVALPARTASAVELDDFIQAQGEAALFDLYEEGRLAQEEYEALLDLYANPLDLSEASVEELYRLPNLSLEEAEDIVARREAGGAVTPPAVLAEAGLISEAQATALRPFVSAPAPPGQARPLRVSMRVGAQLLVGGGPPPAYAAARMRVGALDLGVSLSLSHQRLGRVGYDAQRQALVAQAPHSQVAAPRFHLAYARGPYRLIAGTYRAGFAEGLVFDQTGLRSPEGARVDTSLVRGFEAVSRCRLSVAVAGGPCDGPEGGRSVAPDPRARGGLRGLFVEAKELRLGRARVSAQAFGSYATEDVYQYALYDAGRCADPRLDEEACAALPVYLAGASGEASAPRFRYVTLPTLRDVGLGGGRLALGAGALRVGLTGYGAQARYRVAGVQLDTKPSGGLPFGGAFGALGLDARARLGPLNLGVELARSFDGSPEGGGYGALARGTFALDEGQLELSGRFYDRGFANPYFGGVAAPDTFEGWRARDELGGQLRYAGRLVGGRLSARAQADAHLRPSLGVVGASASARLDGLVAPGFSLGGLVRIADRDLRRAGRGGCYEGEGPSQGGEARPCGGARMGAGLRVRVARGEAFVLGLSYDHSFVDVIGEPMRQGIAGALRLSGRVGEWLRVGARARLWNAGGLGARGGLDASVALRGWGRLFARYGLAGGATQRRLTHMLSLELRVARSGGSGA